jgi:peptidoglycan/LPS O-acetylase OafA/YrhL
MTAGVSEQERSANLDILRACAALAVLAGHAYLLSGGYLDPRELRPDHLLITSGANGVWLFFALSGYLIAGPYLSALLDGAPLPEPRPYVVRRVARIFPAYLIAFAIAAWVSTTAITRWWQWPLHVTLLHNLVPREQQSIFFASWTLTLEVLFYMFVPLAASLVRRLVHAPISSRALALGIGALWAASAGLLLIGDEVEKSHAVIGLWLRLVFPSMLGSFCPGMLIAVAIAAQRRGQPWRWWTALIEHQATAWAVAASLAAVGCVLYTRIDQVELYDLSRWVFAVASGIVVGIAAGRGAWRGRLARVLAWLGLISYGIYLYQAVILQVLDKHGLHTVVPFVRAGDAAYAVHLVYLAALTIPLAWLSWTLVERPVMAWARRMIGRRPQSAPRA